MSLIAYIEGKKVSNIKLHSFSFVLSINCVLCSEIRANNLLESKKNKKIKHRDS